MKQILLHNICFFFVITQLIIGATHIDTEHALAESTANCILTDSISTNNTDKNNHHNPDNEASHHCCSMCHVYSATIESTIIMEAPKVLFTDKLKCFYSNTYFALVHLSLFRPPIV